MKNGWLFIRNKAFLWFLIGAVIAAGLFLAISHMAGEQRAGEPMSQANLVLGDEEAAVPKCPYPNPGQGAYVLAEWDFDADIDLCIYKEQTGRCIGTIPLLSDADEFLYCDNDGSLGCEWAYLGSYAEGIYTLYLKNHDAVSGNRSTGTGSITVSIYAAEELLWQDVVQVDENGVLWKCASICYGEVEEQNECILDLADYAWAARSKENPAAWAKETNVERMEEYHFGSAGGFPLRRIQVCEYNDEGRQAAEIEYSSIENSHIENSNTENSHADSGAMDSPLPFPLYQHSAYNEGGVPAEEFIYRPVQAYEHEYDEYGSEKRGCIYNPAGLECICRYECQYDEKGRVLLRERYDSYLQDDSYPQDEEEVYEFLADREKYEYDEHGNVTAHYYDENQEGTWELFGAYEYQYDEEGRITACQEVDGGKIEYHYDAEGNRKDSYWYAFDGSLSSYEEYQYDDQGTLRNRCSYLGSGKKDAEFEYDEMGNLVAAYAFYDGDRHLNERYEYQYDANAGMAAVCRYDGEGVLQWKKVAVYHP